jgi:3-oxoadipate enol-lactonase
MTNATIDVPGARLRYRAEGTAHAPVVVLASSLGTTLEMWDGQIAALTTGFRVLRYDMRGHGTSSVSALPLDIPCLAGDVLLLLDAIGAASAHVVGLSLGGMVGLWLAAHAPARVDSLVLSNTAALIGTRETWDARIAAATRGGTEAIAESVLERWFTARFREREPERVQGLRRMLVATSLPGYLAACAAIRDADLRGSVASVRAPTLVITGDFDLATPPSGGRFIADRIAGAQQVELQAAHLSNIEAESDWNASVLGFISAREKANGRARAT